jgi:Tfp pilus assembly protein PilV
MRRNAQPGAVLVEIIISVLLTAVAVSAILGAMLSTSQQAARSQARERAALCLYQLVQELRNYVTADASPNPDAPGGGGADGWRLPGDACGCWALDETQPHDVSARLPAELAQSGATMSYTVQVVPVNGLQSRQVTATLNWTPPSP